MTSVDIYVILVLASPTCLEGGGGRSFDLVRRVQVVVDSDRQRRMVYSYRPSDAAFGFAYDAYSTRFRGSWYMNTRNMTLRSCLAACDGLGRLFGQTPLLT